MCEGVGFGGLIHMICCPTEGCDTIVVGLAGKEHALCACCFAPLDDGDTGLVKDEEIIVVDTHGGARVVSPLEKEDA